ncbi:hypothetical protein AVEN_4396-1 [Araneus ventricosus]|uniref:Uncharacterized protein n=1 Tax=Araneus ventricosus TaxID=182803 RepID=A0A4Y2NBC1_ARAVE|nr:hypothetical protein AVEN_4396-1 [Araneus ventricosus]
MFFLEKYREECPLNSDDVLGLDDTGRSLYRKKNPQEKPYNLSGDLAADRPPQGAKGEQMRRKQISFTNPRVGVRSVSSGIVCTEGGMDDDERAPGPISPSQMIECSTFFPQRGR